MATQTNKFANDGSFLEQFLKLQEEKKKSEEAKEESKESATIPSPKKQLIGRIGSLKKRTVPSSSKPISQQKVHKVFRDDSDSDPEENEGNKTSNIKQCIQSSKTEDDISMAISEAVERAKRVAKLSNEQDSPRSQASSNVGPRKRKSRWGDEPPASKATVDSAIASSSGSNYLTPEQQRQLIEQQEMDKLVASIRSAAQKRGKDKGGQYEYDSDEDTEGGTWEHKKRQQEMQKTRGKALGLTEQAKGKHFIGDFLPPEELEKFLEKVQALKEGRDPDFSDYAKYKLQEDNVGYQLLQKAGWTEGSGLGPKEDGRTAPVNKGKQSLDNSGVGTEGVGEVKKEDNEFELYRKRMMLAYRFRPNPLNNPRRPYY